MKTNESVEYRAVRVESADHMRFYCRVVDDLGNSHWLTYDQCVQIYETGLCGVGGMNVLWCPENVVKQIEGLINN